MVCIVVLLTLLLYVNGEHTTQPLTITVDNTSTGLYECNIKNNILTEGESAFIKFYKVRPDVHCSSNNQILKWEIHRELEDYYREYEIKKVEAWMNGTWKCNILPNGDSCDVNVRIRAHESWVIKVNDAVIGTNQTNEDVYESVAEYEFCENEWAHVECGRSKPAIIMLKVQDEPSVNCIRHNTVQADMFMKMKPEYDGKHIECYYNEYGEVWVVRIKLKQIYGGTSQDYGPSGMCSTKTYESVDLNTTLNICHLSPNLRNLPPSFPHLHELIGLEPSNFVFLYENSTGDKEIHYEYTDNQTLNLSWKVVLVANILNEYTLYWKDTSISSLPINTDEASCEVTQVYPPITLGPEDDDTIIRFAVTMDEITVDKYRIILRRVSHNTINDSPKNKSAEKKSDPNLMIYIVTGVLGCIIVILIAGIIWISKLSTLRKPEPILCSNGEETCYSHVYEEIPPFPPQWDKFSCRESTNSAYEGDDVEYSEIGAAAEQSRDE